MTSTSQVERNRVKNNAISAGARQVASASQAESTCVRKAERPAKVMHLLRVQPNETGETVVESKIVKVGNIAVQVSGKRKERNNKAKRNFEDARLNIQRKTDREGNERIIITGSFLPGWSFGFESWRRSSCGRQHGLRRWSCCPCLASLVGLTAGQGNCGTSVAWKKRCWRCSLAEALEEFGCSSSAASC